MTAVPVTRLRNKPSSELLREWCELTLELAARHALPTVGPPMSGLAERLAVELHGGRLARPGQRDWDVEAPMGRIQVKALWDVGRRTRRRLGTVGTELDLLIAVIFDAHGRIAEVWEVGAPALGDLRGDAERAVVRLPWVRRNGARIPVEQVRAAAGALQLEVAATA